MATSILVVVVKCVVSLYTVASFAIVSVLSFRARDAWVSVFIALTVEK